MKFKNLLLFLFCLLISSCGSKMIDNYKEYSNSNGSINYRLIYPYKYDDSKSYSLLVFLHGIGERGNDNELQLKYIDEVILDKSNRKNFPSFVLLPQAPLNDNWSSRKLTNKKIRQVFSHDASPTNSLSLVMSLLDDLVNDKKINNKRVYLTGLSNGAMGSFELLKHRPNMFASAVLICGGGNPQWAKEFAKSTPVWIAHGSDDIDVHPSLSLNMADAIIKYGGSPKLTLYENVAHDSWNNVFRDPDFLNWIFDYSKN